MTEYHESANFHVLKERIRFQGILETKTALRIGSGGAGPLDGSDLPVLKDSDGYPLIPGSSLKGVLRSTIEALVRGASRARGQGGVWTCDPLVEEKSEEPTCGRHKSGAGSRTAALAQEHCAVCRLFGSRVISSHVRISDALLRGADTLKRSGQLPIELRDGVAIDRDLRTAYGGQKYDFEVISPGTQFDLEVFVENPEDWLMGLLAVGLEQLAEGFTAVGGFTSRGLGRVRIEWEGMSRYEARSMLEGKPPSMLGPSELNSEFSRWREALSEAVGRRN